MGQQRADSMKKVANFINSHRQQQESQATINMNFKLNDDPFLADSTLH